jgi:hypothetical protein
MKNGGLDTWRSLVNLQRSIFYRLAEGDPIYSY